MKNKSEKDPKSGVQLPSWLKVSFTRAAKAAGGQVKDAYADACKMWLKERAVPDSAILWALSEEASKSDDVRRELAALGIPLHTKDGNAAAGARKRSG